MHTFKDLFLKPFEANRKKEYKNPIHFSDLPNFNCFFHPFIPNKTKVESVKLEKTFDFGIRLLGIWFKCEVLSGEGIISKPE